MKYFLFALILFPGIINAKTIPQKADELLSAYTDQHKFSGNVLIARKGAVIFEKSYGFADLKTKRLNDAGTEFRVGSLTKMFTSTLILQMVASSQMSLTDAVSKYVPSFNNGDQIQIAHLLNHSSGIKGITVGTPQSLEESVSSFSCEQLAFTPGSRFEYNNFNYILLSYIAQKITGISFPELLQTNVLQKAGMTHSGLDQGDRLSKNKALGYALDPQTAAWQETMPTDVALATGAGALYSTARDLYIWSKAFSKKTLLSEADFSKAITPLQNNYGFGWMINETNGRLQIGHTGSIPGFIANFMLFPKEDITIIFLANFQHTNGRQLSNDLVALVFDEPYKLPVEKKAVVLANNILQKYAGEYRSEKGFSIHVSVEDNKLLGQPQGDPYKYELIAESEKKFYLKGPETEIEFLVEGNAVKYMFVNMQGGQKFTKVQ